MLPLWTQRQRTSSTWRHRGLPDSLVLAPWCTASRINLGENWRQATRAPLVNVPWRTQRIWNEMNQLWKCFYSPQKIYLTRTEIGSGTQPDGLGRVHNLEV